nr:MAG TPA: hypothetical protein [Crassvirales sp.]
MVVLQMYLQNLIFILLKVLMLLVQIYLSFILQLLINEKAIL